jgi:hypothetical protein
MRRTSLMVAVASALATSAGAETRLGLFGGLNLATQRIRPAGDAFTVGTRTGGAVGIVVAVDLGGPFSLRLEPSYVQKGSTIDAAAVLAVPIPAAHQLSYAELPVLLQASTRKGRVRPYAALGAAAGYLLKARTRLGEGEGAIDVNFKDRLKKADASALLGAGVQVVGTRMRFFLEGRYALGLVNVDKDPSEGASLKSRGIQALAGLTWRLGH